MSASDFTLPPPVHQMPVADDKIQNRKQLVEFASELQDTEAKFVANVMVKMSQKWSSRACTVKNLEQMRDEILELLAKGGILATVDVAPVLNGEPPVVEIVGHMSGTERAEYGMDHERKQWEVQKAHARGEFFLGEKEHADSTPAKKRDAAEREKRKGS
jgi:hypothetical protein